MTNDRLRAQRALEALRNGVPNRDAVRALGCTQPEAVDAFRGQLDRLSTGDPTVVPGTLVVGGFGAGKSHTLAFLADTALQRRFLVSKVVVSKETPLYDPAKLFVAAVREARLPDGRGEAIGELALRLDYRSERAEAFAAWAATGQPFGLVAATVAIHERTREPEVGEKIVQFWAGEKLGIAEIRAALRDVGLASAYDVRTVRVGDLAPVRFELVARLARAAGLGGWVLLLDEVELVGRYGLLQRARAYAELARLFAAVHAQGIPGLTAVAAITDDFAAELLVGRNDLQRVPERLRSRGDDQSLRAAALAESGMALIHRAGIALHPPDDDTLRATWEKLAALYEAAYGWRPTDAYDSPGGWHRTMRSYVRRWITEWDLRRLYPDQSVATVETPPGIDYVEDAALQRGDPDEPGT